MFNCPRLAHACPRQRPRQNTMQLFDFTMPTPPTPLRARAHINALIPLNYPNTARAYTQSGVVGVGIVESIRYRAKWRGQRRGQPWAWRGQRVFCVHPNLSEG